MSEAEAAVPEDPTEGGSVGSSKARGCVLPPHVSTFVRFILYRLNNNMEAQVLITGKSAIRGMGKTQLAIVIAKWIHECGICPHCRFIWPYPDPVCPRCEEEIEAWRGMPSWTYEDNAFLRVQRYTQACLSTSQEVLVFDEIEYSADRRRWMTKDNVELSQAMMTLRIQNNIMIATLPTAAVLDPRIESLADIWINIPRRGDAHAYYLWMNDFPPYQKSRIRLTLENGMEETIHWRAIDGDEDYQKLSKDKYRLMRGAGDSLSEEVREELKQLIREEKIEIIENLLATTEVPQIRIAAAFDVGQGWVSRVNRGVLEEQEEVADRYPIRTRGSGGK